MSEEACAKCGETFNLEPWLDKTKFCHGCAQAIIERLLSIIPKPAIQRVHGRDIFAVLQCELYPELNLRPSGSMRK